MTGRRSAARKAVVLAGAALLACLVLPLAPQQASACAVSYGYKPTFKIGKGGLSDRKPCSTGTSLMGATVVALLAAGALAAAGGALFRRGAAIAGPSSPAQAGQTLAGYLNATGVTRPAAQAMTTPDRPAMPPQGPRWAPPPPPQPAPAPPPQEPYEPPAAHTPAPPPPSAQPAPAAPAPPPAPGPAAPPPPNWYPDATPSARDGGDPYGYPRR